MRGLVLMFDPLELLKVTVISEAVEGGWGGGVQISGWRSFCPREAPDAASRRCCVRRRCKL